MCANNIKNVVPVNNYGLKLQIKEKVFVKIMKKQPALTSILKGFLYLVKGNSIEKDLIMDRIKIDYKIYDDSIVVEDISIPQKWQGNSDKLSFVMTDHFLEQIFERKLNAFDWSILCNVYKDVIQGNHEIGQDIEKCNKKSTIIYSLAKECIVLITGWNGSRNKSYLSR